MAISILTSCTFPFIGGLNLVTRTTEAINCGKLQVKTMIYGAKTKETNQSNYLMEPKHITQAKQSKIVKS